MRAEAGQAKPFASPAELYGALLPAVQMSRVFQDGKTFVDCTARRSTKAIMADFDRLPDHDADLSAFIADNFALPHAAEVPAPHGRQDVRGHIADLWPQLVREPHEVDQGSSNLPLPHPYLVPGGRFAELYYWDSYFSMLGLVRDGHVALAQDLLDNFTVLIERHGFVPNGTRTYYLSRSQPPFYAAMVALLPHHDPGVGQRRLAAMIREHGFWMRGEVAVAPGQAAQRVVRMADGALLNRYWDDRSTPRDESFAEDVSTAAMARDRGAANVFRDLRAAAESGWDFSSRWMADGGDLSTIRTTRILPVDLNSFLYLLEDGIARLAKYLHRDEATVFSRRAADRRRAIQRHLWSSEAGFYADYDLDTGRRCDRLTAATLAPLFAGVANRDHADAVARKVTAQLLAPGGLRTTLVVSGEQWDGPNGWAPLQWIGFHGLWRYGHQRLAREIARRWCGMVETSFLADGWLHEKYDVEQARPGHGGEYVPQHGFGWTNGVTAAFWDILGHGSHTECVAISRPIKTMT